MKYIFITFLAAVTLRMGAVASAADKSTEAAKVFDVQKFGAIPNDNKDQTAAIQAAIDAAPNGSTIYFPMGVYYLHSLKITNRAGLAFVGDGPSVSIVKRPATAPPDARIATMDSCTDMVITQLGFDVNGILRFGGFMCFYSKRVTFTGTHFFDSNKQPLGIEDRYAMVFGVGSQPSEDILISQNRVEDLQVEVDYVRRARIVGNTVMRPVKTAGIGTFTLKPSGGLTEDLEIAGNTIIDPVLEAGAITVHLDPPTTNDGTLRNIRIRDNFILYTAALKTATNEFWDAEHGRTWPPAVQFGTGDMNAVTKGNTFDGISIERNTIWVDPKLGSIRYGIIFGNASVKSNFKFMNLRVTNNVIFYNGEENFLNIGFGDFSRAENLDQSGNVVRRLELSNPSELAPRIER